MEILILGAGPVGLSAALELAHNGLLPELIEKRPGPSEFSRAVGIIPTTRHNLRHQGVGDAILKAAVPWRKFAFYRAVKRARSESRRRGRTVSVHSRLAPGPHRRVDP